MNEIEKVFTEKFIKNSWKGSESKSGPGSSISVNKKLISLLQDFFYKKSIKRILDCGCGDFNWMKEFDFIEIESYLGVDIVEKIISENINRFENEKIKFKKMNIVSDTINEKYDAVLCKDVLFHLSFDDAICSIDNIKNSQSELLISTTFIGFENEDIKTGNWRPINLETYPFNLGQPIILWENIEDKITGYTNKSIGIWKIN